MPSSTSIGPQKKQKAQTAKQDRSLESSSQELQIQFAPSVATIQRAQVNPSVLTTADVMALQRTVGNQAVARLLANRGGMQQATHQSQLQKPAVVADEKTVGHSPKQMGVSTIEPRIQRVKDKIKFQGQSQKIDQGDKKQFKAALAGMSSKNVKVVAPEQKPRAILLMGGSGSGKSSMLPVLVPDKENFVHVDSDQVKEAMPEYQAGIAQGDQSIAGKVHGQSKGVASYMANHAMNTRRNLLFDATGGDSAEYLSLINSLRAQGYEITLAMSHISVDEALKRVAARAAQTGRKIPDSVVRDMYKWVPLNFLQFVSMVDHAYLFDNMVHPGEAPRLLWETTDGTKLKKDETDFLQEIVGKIRATKIEDVDPAPNDDSDDRAHLPLAAHRRYLQDGGTSRWMADTNSWKAAVQTSRKVIGQLDESLKLYRQYKSKNRGNAEEQGHLLLQMKNAVETSHYQSGTPKNSETFQRRQQATSMLAEEVTRELPRNPIRLKKIVSDAEKVKELTKVGFTKSYLSKILEFDLNLLYEAHAGLAHQQLALAQNALDRLNPVQRDDTGKLKYAGKYLKRTRNQMHFAQQILSAHHHVNIGGLYSRAFTKAKALTGGQMQNITDKYIRNKNFLSEDVIESVKKQGMGAKELSQLVRDYPSLTQQELEAIRIYSNDKYKEMNATMHDIRTDAPDEQEGFEGWSSISEVAFSGLSKLPSYAGPIVYRGDTNFGGLLNAAQIGTVFQTPSFMSTSKSASIAGIFGGDVGWAVRVAPNSRGKDIQPISVAEREEEVLFPPGTKMMVVDIFRRHEDTNPVPGETKAKRLRRLWQSESGAPLTQEIYDFIFQFTGKRTVLIVVQELN